MIKRLRRWLHAHRLLLAVLSLVVTAAYFVVITFVQPAIAGILGIGYVIFIVTLTFLMQFFGHH